MIAIIVNGFYETQSTKYQAQRLKKQLEILGQTAVVVKNNTPFCLQTGDVPKSCKFCSHGYQMADFLQYAEIISPNAAKMTDVPKSCRFCSHGYQKAIFLDKDINLAKGLESSGIRVFNGSDGIQRADDKVRTFFELRRAKSFGLPRTVVLPKRYKNTIEDEFFDAIEQELGYPIVIKESSGSLGEQVYLAKNRKELLQISFELRGREFFFQQFIGESYGKSIRVYVVANRAVGAIRYTNLNDFRSNLSQGGTFESVALTKRLGLAAVEAAKGLGLDFCGVDFFDTEKPLLIEVNSNAFFRAFEDEGQNIAKLIAEYVVKR